MIIDENDVRTLEEFTPVAGAIKSRAIPDWIVMIVTDEKHRDIVSRNAEKILFG